MPQTITQVATRALSSDFDSGRLAEGTAAVRDAIGEIYATTTLVRGDMPIQLADVSTVVGGATQLANTYEQSRVEAVIHSDTGGELEPMALADLLQLRQAQPARGRPLAFAVTGGNLTGTVGSVIELWPTADRTYQLYLLGQRGPNLTDLEDADTVPLPDRWLKLPYYYARSELFKLDSDFEAASVWGTDWINGCALMRGDLQKRLGGGNRIIPGTWSGGSGGSGAPQFHRPGLF